MYLSRLLLNPRNRQAQREITDPYNLHRSILRAFNSSRETAVVLHRLETSPHNGQTMLLVQSASRPDWTWLTEKGYLLPTDPFSGLDNPAVKEIDFSLRNGRILQFRLTANPTIKKVRRDENGERLNSNRVPLLREEKQRAWLQKQAADNGFQILQVAVSHQQKLTSCKKNITLYTVKFNGRLQITSADRFETAVQTGIGPAKAFGCGLLSLAPT
jgi:CRISPR system Cascade subunit CasE